MATLLIRRAGVLATIQDLGRAGWGRFGVPPSGAMDALAARAANALVGDGPGTSLLELTGPGASVALDEARLVAVAGAELGGEISGGALSPRPVAAWTAVWLSPGETLTFTQRRRGARALLAVAGGILAPLRFGSAATDPGNQLGGLDGRPLRAGDRLPLGQPPPSPSSAGAPVDALVNHLYADPDRLRYLPVPGSSVAVTATVAAATFVVTPQSNRVGFRLRSEGGAFADRPAADLVSEPIAPGTLQLPPDGQPILLMADRQTVGGYPVLGHVIAADLSRAAQLWPGDRLRLVPVTLDEAQALSRQQAARFAAWLAGLAAI